MHFLCCHKSASHLGIIEVRKKLFSYILTTGCRGSALCLALQEEEHDHDLCILSMHQLAIVAKLVGNMVQYCSFRGICVQIDNSWTCYAKYRCLVTFVF